MRALQWLLAILALAILLLKAMRGSPGKNGNLPHNEVFNSITAAEAVERLRKSPLSDVEFAVSRGFWEDDSEFDEIYAAYEGHFEERLAELQKLLGPPVFEGHPKEKAYPIFAIGERVAVWGAGDATVYLRLQHEDRELGIEVSLLTPKSPNSNHGAKSYYEGLWEGR
jgi:hypothetical protein